MQYVGYFVLVLPILHVEYHDVPSEQVVLAVLDTNLYVHTGDAGKIVRYF